MVKCVEIFNGSTHMWLMFRKSKKKEQHKNLESIYFLKKIGF